jgi:hypothetical protein
MPRLVSKLIRHYKTLEGDRNMALSVLKLPKSKPEKP